MVVIVVVGRVVVVGDVVVVAVAVVELAFLGERALLGGSSKGLPIATAAISKSKTRQPQLQPH